ncbi:hypothetical protein [Micromonospora sp. RTGN7]|uniref:hypothetical protein n=1 Tax=Micromonospora sp. RTGN7 TaxID=3016526 RepID=UPI0029FF564B|nr:hypothetical protein [Micromonospora sp. RTGN7]
MTKADRKMAEKIRTGRAAVKFAGVRCLGKPDEYFDGAPAARHYLLTARAEAALAPRTVRTTHTGRRVLMRRTERLRWV